MKNTIGLNMKKIIKETGNTHESASALLDIRRPTLTNYLNGRNEPNIEFLTKFCKTFNVTPNHLFGFTEIEITPKYLEVDIKLILDIVDTLNFFLKKEKYTMDEEDRLKLISYLYSQNVKDSLPLLINTWITANPAIITNNQQEVI